MDPLAFLVLLAAVLAAFALAAVLLGVDSRPGFDGGRLDR